MESSIGALIDSATWLQLYGLQRNKLSLSQVLATVGFKHSEAYVPGVGRPVEARYNRGLFPQYHSKDGTVFNLVASPEQMERLSGRLLAAIELLKKRLHFITTGSRRVFGAIHTKRPVIVVNAADCLRVGDDLFDDVVSILGDVISEQLARKEAFNLVWAGTEVSSWQDRCSHPFAHTDIVSDAIAWLKEQRRLSVATSSGNNDSSSAAEALTVATADRNADAVYLFTVGSLSDSCRYLLRNKAQVSGIPVNVAAFNCTDVATLDALKAVAKLSGGCCLTSFKACDDDGQGDESPWQRYVNHPVGQPNLRSVTNASRVIAWPDTSSDAHHHTFSSSSGVNTRHDVARDSVQLVWEELEEARNTLAELQAMSYDLPRPACAPLPHDREFVSSVKSQPMTSNNGGGAISTDLYLSSAEWLKIHGLQSRKLLLHDVLSGLAFRHCDAVVTLHHHMTSIPGDVIPTTSSDKLIGAKYCGNFAHFRWPDGSVVHLHVTHEAVRTYHTQVTAAIHTYLNRITWLRQGSRELFGTLIENKVALLIDTSSSMLNRLDLVKAKLQVLLQEQLRHKLMFNLIRYSSTAVSWRPALVHVSSQSLQDAWRWILSLNAGGSTNTLSALRLALSDPSVEAVYLLTDGRPDQPPESIHAQVQMTSKVPVHTISFNCADSQANQFLHQLAKDTGGRYHYFSEDAVDESGPIPYESEDIRLLQEEIETARSDLKRMMELREECIAVEKQRTMFNSGDQVKKAKTAARPSSSPAAARSSSRVTTSPQSSMSRPSSSAMKSKKTRQPIFHAKTKATKAGVKTSASESAVGDQSAQSASSDMSSVSSTSVSSVSTAVASSADEKSVRTVDRSSPSDHTDGDLSSSKSAISTAGSRSSSRSSQKPKEHKSRKPKQAKSKVHATYQPSEKWLSVHGLAVSRLTIMDVLRSTVIEQRSTFVPILKKNVSSKVFDDILPMRHIAHGSGDVSIVNPQAVDLKGYEDRLSTALEKIHRKLTTLVWDALPRDTRTRLSSDGTPVSFMERHDELLRLLEELRWPAKRQDVMLLIKEINTGETFMKQSISLRESAAATGTDGMKELLSNPDLMRATLKTLTPTTREAATTSMGVKRRPVQTSTSRTGRTPAKCYKSHASTSREKEASQVTPTLTLARFDVDGYFYEATVSKTLNARNIVVNFENGQEQQLPRRHLVTLDVAKSRPALIAGDCVLVQTSQPVPGTEGNDLITPPPPSMTCYVPGQVAVVPQKASPSKTTSAASMAFYTIRLYTSSQITAFRDDLIKISRSQCSLALRYIQSIEPAGNSVQLTLFPSATQLVTGPAPAMPGTTLSSHDATPTIMTSPQPAVTSPQPDMASPKHSTSTFDTLDGGTGDVQPRSAAVGAMLTIAGTQTLSDMEDDKISNASSASTSSTARQRRFSAHTLQQLSEQTGKLHALHEDLVDTMSQDKASISMQCETLVKQHQSTMTLSQQLQQEHVKQTQQMRDQLLAEQRSQQTAFQNAMDTASKLDEQRRQEALDEHKKQATALQTAIEDQGKMQRLIEEHQRQQEQTFEAQKEKLAQLVESMNNQQKQNALLVAAEHEQLQAESAERQREVAEVLAEMRLEQEELQHKQEELELAQKAVEETNFVDMGDLSAVPSGSNVAELQASLSDVLDQLPEGSQLESVKTADGQDALLIRHGDVGVIVSPGHVRTPSATAFSPLSPGDEVIARSEDVGWYFPGVIQSVHDPHRYLVVNGCGQLEVVSRHDIISDNDDCTRNVNLGDPVLALHPDFVNSYAPGYVEKVHKSGRLKVAFYDGAKSRVERYDTYLIAPEDFTRVSVYIRHQEANVVGKLVVARYDRDGFYYPGRVMSQLGASHTYTVQFSPSGTLHTQVVQHIFYAHKPRAPITLGSRVLAPMQADKSTYLPGWVSSDKDGLLAVSFVNGQQCRSVPLEECYWMSTLYYNQAIQFMRQLAA